MPSARPEHSCYCNSSGRGSARYQTAAPTNGKLILTISRPTPPRRGARTAERRERAKGRGVKRGRKLERAIKCCEGDGEPIREITGSYNVSHSTIFRLSTYILCLSGLSNGTPGKYF